VPRWKKALEAIGHKLTPESLLQMQAFLFCPYPLYWPRHRPPRRFNLRLCWLAAALVFGQNISSTLPNIRNYCALSRFT
jgi:hypothetical protein